MVEIPPYPVFHRWRWIAADHATVAAPASMARLDVTDNPLGRLRNGEDPAGLDFDKSCLWFITWLLRATQAKRSPSRVFPAGPGTLR
jgi:hypothetical protein